MDESMLMAVLVAVTAVAWASGALLQWLALRKQERLIDDLKHIAAPAYFDLSGAAAGLPTDQPDHVRGRAPRHW